MFRCLLMLGVLVIFVGGWSQKPAPSRTKTGGPKQEQSNTSQQPTAAYQRGTENSPAFVKVIPTPKTSAEITQEAEESQAKASNDRRLTIFTGLLVLVGLLQLFVFGYQALKLKETVEAAGQQSTDAKSIIAESARTAKAMEDVAKHFERSVAQAEESSLKFQKRMAAQTRAYLVLEIGGGFFQETRKIKFEARPQIANAGNTPAHKVSYKAHAAILPVPLPSDFPFTITGDPKGGALIGPQQKFTINAIVDDFVQEGEIERIKRAEGKSLYIWGIVDYEDIFGEKQWTKFCQQTYWLPNGTIFVIHTLEHNEGS